MAMSSRAEYAVRALILLAQAPDQLVPAEQLAGQQGSGEPGIPGRSLELVMTLLRRADLVRSERGPAGGFALARSPAEISLAVILGAVAEAGS